MLTGLPRLGTLLMKHSKGVACAGDGQEAEDNEAFRVDASAGEALPYAAQEAAPLADAGQYDYYFR